MTVNQEAIQEYCRYFADQLGRVAAVQDPLYQKILFVTLLDALARARFPEASNRPRFIGLVRDLGNWPDCERVSLPQLALILGTQNVAQTARLSREVAQRLARWECGKLYRLEVDPWPHDLEDFAEAPGEKTLIADARHAELFYVYRNHLVHEFRTPGYGMEISDDNSSPYYHGMMDQAGSNTWELVYPIDFFGQIAGACLGNMRKYLESADIDPYSRYVFGSLWKPK